MPGTELEGGCFVLAPDQLDYRREGVWHEAVIVNPERGAKTLSQYAVRVKGRPTDARCYRDSEVVLYVISGRGDLQIGERKFALSPDTGAFVAPEEAFRLASADGEALEVLVTVCPHCDAPTWHSKPPRRFDRKHPERVVSAEDQEEQAAADRSYRVLIDERVGCREMTQFVGRIPKSRAPEHFHEYEEVIVVLGGEGVLHTGEKNAAVGPGSLIFLPRGQRHSLQCTSDEGLRLVGVIHPSGSPAVAYED